MRTQNDPSEFFAPSQIVCPQCFGRMRLVSIMPKLEQRGLDEITYSCFECESDRKQIIQVAQWLPPVLEPLKS